MKRAISKKIGQVLIVMAAAAMLLAGCGKTEQPKQEQPQQEQELPKEETPMEEQQDPTVVENDPIQSEEMTGKLTAALGEENAIYDISRDECYVEEGGDVALLIGSGSVNDHGFLQAIYEGIKKYAEAADVTYSFYSGTEGDDASYKEALDKAVESGANLVVCTSEDFFVLMSEYQYQYPELNFLLIDGQPWNEEWEPVAINKNVHCIVFAEETAGYLAGYITVLDGYRNLGFMGGEDMDTVIKYGYGYLRGIEAAVNKLKEEGVDISDQVRVRYTYTGTFSPSEEIYKKASDWYANGTEVIFSCGGGIYKSILQSAEEADKWIIGVDVDQNGLSEKVLTSARKGIDQAVVVALDEYFAEGSSWSDGYAGKVVKYGPEKWCGDLTPSEETWRFKNISFAEYWDYYMSVHQGEVKISDDIDNLPEVSFDLVME